MFDTCTPSDYTAFMLFFFTPYVDFPGFRDFKVILHPKSNFKGFKFTQIEGKFTQIEGKRYQNFKMLCKC